MSEMVERVARAMVESRPIPEGHIRGDVDWEFFRALARAAIAAMREPTSKMCQAATQIVPTWDDDASARKWRAMIDEALK